MIKRKLLIALPLLLVLLTSCITLKETITVHADGSGKYSLLLDMGMAASLLSGSEQAVDPGFSGFIRAYPGNAEAILKSFPGIDSVTSESSDSKGMYGIEFVFSDTKVLNKALYASFGVKKNMLMPALIKISRHKVVHADLSDLLKKLTKKSKAGIEIPDMAAQMIKVCTDTRLPSPPRRVSNINAVVAGNTVTHCCTLSDLMKGRTSTLNKISY